MLTAFKAVVFGGMAYVIVQRLLDAALTGASVPVVLLQTLVPPAIAIVTLWVVLASLFKKKL